MLKQIAAISLLSLALVACGNKEKAAPIESVRELTDTVKKNSKMHLLVGTYTSGDNKGEGIYVFNFDIETGESVYTSQINVANPSYMAITNDKKYVYSVSENGDGTDAVNAFAFDAKFGELTLLNSQLTKGDAPCYISVDQSASNVVTANYTGGSISTFKLDKNGKLGTVDRVIKFSGKGVDKKRQTQPHLHCVIYSPDGRHLFASDLGTDKIYKFDVSNGHNYLQLSNNPSEFKLKDGSGPRLLTFHPHHKYAYLITEISGEVAAFHYNDGNLEHFQTIEADSLHAQGSADIHISPDGRHLYASNRLQGDGLAIFSINKFTGQLSYVGYQYTGTHPRSFAIAPNGKYVLVACRDSHVIEVYERDKETGLLNNVVKDIEVGSPVCLQMVEINE